MSKGFAPGLGKRKVLILIVAVSVFGVLTWYLRNHVSLDELVAQEERMREAINLRPWRSFAIGLAIYAVVSLVPGTTGKAIIFAWLYGFWQGVAMILLGLTAAATVVFYLSRYVFRGWIEHRYGRFLSVLNGHLEKEGAFYMLVLRMAHFPYPIVNLASGASRVSPWTFCWTTAVGMVPGTLVFAYVGMRLPSLDELAARGAWSLVDAPLIAAFGVSAVLPFVFRWIARKVGILKNDDSGPDSASDQQPQVPDP